MDISFLIVLLATSGMLVSVYIFLQKNRKKSIMCFIGKNCNDVIYSKYSSFFGIRNEVLGIIYYALIILGLFTDHILIISAFIALLYSLYLTYLQIYVLRRVCDLCLLANFSNALILLLLFIRL